MAGKKLEAFREWLTQSVGGEQEALCLLRRWSDRFCIQAVTGSA